MPDTEGIAQYHLSHGLVNIGAKHHICICGHGDTLHTSQGLCWVENVKRQPDGTFRQSRCNCWRYEPRQ